MRKRIRELTEVPDSDLSGWLLPLDRASSAFAKQADLETVYLWIQGKLDAEETGAMPVAVDFSVYRLFPPVGGSAPVATAISGTLTSDYARGAQALNSNLRTWTHRLVVPASLDVRDGYKGSTQVWQYQDSDVVVIPTQTGNWPPGAGTAYVVVMVQQFDLTHKVLFLDRQDPHWPVL
jgi:hypothetical protein